MEIQIIDPLADPRWEELTARHPKASAFHTRGWLRALSRTYGYRPFSITTSGPGSALQNAIVLCEVSSWITGKRAVSLPFSDHCEPLLEGREGLENLGEWLAAAAEREHWKYVEIRPQAETGNFGSEFKSSSTFFLHKLDLAPSTEQLFDNLHKDSIQRKIRRAERDGVQCETGRSKPLLDQFYNLLCLTRKRHQLVPQPRSWFWNLIENVPDALIRVARKGSTPIAAILSLGHRRSVIYKYGCSNEQFHPLGGMPFLFWKLIEESRDSGAEEIDFGRSDTDQQGLVTFKNRLGCRKLTLTYYRHSKSLPQKAGSGPWHATQRLIKFMPDGLRQAAGRLLYRHMG